MKSDLDRLMQTYSLEAIFVLGGEMPNMQRDYLMKGAHTSGYVIKKRGAEPVAIVGGMEIDEAAKSGLKIYTYQDFGDANPAAVQNRLRRVGAGAHERYFR